MNAETPNVKMAIRAQSEFDQDWPDIRAGVLLRMADESDNQVMARIEELRERGGIDEWIAVLASAAMTMAASQAFDAMRKERA